MSNAAKSFDISNQRST